MAQREKKAYSLVVRVNGSKALHLSSAHPISREEQRQALITVHGAEEGEAIFRRIAEAKKTHRSDE